jgi:energy-coupling factor transporter ATP-binding protein EcfA2
MDSDSKSASLTGSDQVGIPPLARFFWQLGGADPELLPNCPVHERNKFSSIALANILIAAAMSALTGIVLASFITYLFKTPDSPSWLPSFIMGVAGFFSLFAFVGTIRLLLFAVQSFIARNLQLVRAAAETPAFVFKPLIRGMRPFAPSILLALWGTVMVFVLISGWKDVGPERTTAFVGIQLAFILVFQMIVLLSPIAIASIWTSPIYDRLLTKTQTTTAKPESPDPTNGANRGGSVSSEQLIELKALQDAFNRSRDNVRVGRALIDLYIANGDLQETLPIFDSLIVNNPKDVTLLREKALMYQRLGDDTRYRRILDQVDQITVRESFERNVGKQFILRDLEMRDLAFFGNFKWEFQPGLNILLGRNGYGKSHLLRALVAALESDERLTNVYFESSSSASMIRVDIDKEAQRVSTVRKFLVFDESFGKVPVLAIPDTRYIDKSRDTISVPIEQVSDFRSQAARHFLQEQSYEGLILSFLYELSLDYLEREKSFDAPVFKLIEDSINRLAGPISADAQRPVKPEFKFHNIVRRDNGHFDIFVRTEGNESKPLPIQKASQGTLSVVAMIGSVYRYLKAIYRDVNENEVSHQRALVVIDEIDAHLHPSWQQRIVPLFRDTFPNVQFVITAHNPLVVAGAREREVGVLRPSPAGFVVEVAEGHFIGATAAEMYRRVFDIEEKDPTYLRLDTLHMKKTQIETEFIRLEEQTNRNQKDEHKFEELSSQLDDLRKFEEVRTRREQAERLEGRNRDLEAEMLRQEGKIAELSAQLARRATGESETQKAADAREASRGS